MWNHHSLSSANNRSPIQLWMLGMLNNASSAYTAVNEVLDGNNGADAETDSDDTMGNNDDMDEATKTCFGCSPA